MKRGGVSWNTGSKQKGVRTHYKCINCGRQYKMEWAKNKHQKCDGYQWLY